MLPIPITTIEEYQYVVERGYIPLLDYKHFKMDIRLRVQIQKEIFGHCTIGRGDIPAANERFFRWVWQHKRQQCEETLRPLRHYSASFCSHILTRGAFPEMAHDPRNINILCLEMHNKWEYGARSEMRIYPENLRVIELLKNDYMQLYENKD